MKTTRKLTFHTDPGHGWLQVDRADLDALDIAHKISRYSYERGPWVYLEEDCDAALFMNAAKTAGWVLNMTEKNEPHNDSPVRSFERYQPRVTTATLINAAQRLGRLHLVHISK
jgi:hypothetical protein